MKAERRHELQHNELADWVAASIERVKPYSRAITGVAVIAAVLLVAYVVLSNRAEKKRSAAWNDYYSALQSPSKEGVEADLEAVARDHKNAEGGLWAEVALADIKLGEGVSSYFSDKTAAEKKLKQAIEHYEAILSAASDPLLLARARFGMARALESVGQLKDARAVYEEIVDESGTSAYASVAKARLEDLGRDSTRDFYAWFAEQQPVVVPESSFPGTPGERPLFDGSTFGSPGNFNFSGDKILDFPSLDKGTTGPLLTPSETQTTGETPTDSKGDDDKAKEPGVEENSNDKGATKSEESKTGGGGENDAKEETSQEKKKD